MENSEKNLQGRSFKGQNLANADLSGADLRGADFSGAILTNADFSKCKTGLKPTSVVLVFIFALVISLISGYLAMLTGETVQFMIKSTDTNVVASGYITVGMIIIFIAIAIWKGGQKDLITISAAIVIALLTGLILRLSGAGTGMGSIYSSLSLILFVLMVFTGTVSRVMAGSLSTGIIFIIVAVAGSVFSKSLGGGMGTMVMAVACAIISKRRILSRSDDYPIVRKIAFDAGSYFGTSFKNADLTGADFSEAVLENTNFKGAKLSGINWVKSVKKFCLEDAG